VREVLGRCMTGKLRSPSPSTIRRRLKALSIADLRHRGEERPEAKPVQHGHAPPARHPLDLVQIDYTPVDLVLVDPVAYQSMPGIRSRAGSARRAPVQDDNSQPPSCAGSNGSGRHQDRWTLQRTWRQPADALSPYGSGWAAQIRRRKAAQPETERHHPSGQAAAISLILSRPARIAQPVQPQLVKTDKYELIGRQS
jgi:hypothetical protein